MNLARGAQTLVAALVLWLAGCGDGVHRGRVIDQDTGEPVAGAIVVGRYMGSIAWGGSSCNRAESAVSDAEGRFELPVDPKDGEPMMEAYKVGYSRGNPNRYAFLNDPWTREWKVALHKWNSENTRSSVVTEEPEVYRFEATAMSASGELRDVFIRRSKGSKEARTRELRLFSMDCMGRPKKSLGLVPLIEAIIEEQQSVGAPDDDLKITRRWLARAVVSR